MTADPPGPASTAPFPRAAALVLLCAAIAIPSYLIGLRLPPSEGPDIVADWLVTRAAVDGTDPYANHEDLAARYGVEYRFRTTPELDSAAVSHPRTPGALFVMTPLLLFPPERLHALAIATTVVCIVLVLLLGCRMAGLPSWWVVPLLIVALLTPPGVLALRHGTQSGAVALLVTAGIFATARSDSVPGGIALGIGTVLKVFPALLVLPLIFGRRRRAAWAFAGCTVGLVLLGFGFPGVGVEGAFQALRSASTNWINLSANGSLARVLVVSGVSPPVAIGLCGVSLGLVAIGLTATGIRARTDPRALLLGILAIGLLWVPLSWNHYDLALLPAAVVAGAAIGRVDAPRPLRGVSVGLLVLAFAPLPVDPGVLSASRRTFLAATIVLVGGRGTQPAASAGEVPRRTR